MGMFNKMMGGMMDKMMGRMDEQEKQQMMNEMMGKFFEGMTAEDKQQMMMKMMPKMIEGMMGGGGDGPSMMERMPEMMMKMMESGQGPGMGMMANKMMGMMAKCLDMVLPNVPTDGRTGFVLDMVGILVQQGASGMSEEERKDFVSQVAAKVAG